MGTRTTVRGNSARVGNSFRPRDQKMSLDPRLFRDTASSVKCACDEFAKFKSKTVCHKSNYVIFLNKRIGILHI